MYKRQPGAGELYTYGTSDYAVTESAGDWTVHMVFGVDSAERLWVLDMWRGRTTPERWIPPLIGMMRKWNPRVWIEEKGQIEKSVAPFLDKSQREEKVWTRRVGLSSHRDKPTRARAIQWRAERYGLWFDNSFPQLSLIHI